MAHTKVHDLTDDTSGEIGKKIVFRVVKDWPLLPAVYIWKNQQHQQDRNCDQIITFRIFRSRLKSVHSA